MALDFPASPTNGQTFTSGGTTWTWDGTKLLLTGGTISPAPDPTVNMAARLDVLEGAV